jgi:signal transduction histidine kinase
VDDSGDVSDNFDGGRSELAALRQTVACIPDGLAITAQPPADKAPRIVLVNAAFHAMAGCATDCPVGGYVIPPANGYLAESNPLWVSLQKSHLSDGVYTDEISYRGKGGAATLLHLRSEPVYDQSRRITHRIAVFRDNTERANLEHLIRRNERLASIGLLAAGIAHEINNPTGAALLAAETALAIKDLPDAGDRLTACLQNIVTSMDRCGRIVRTLLRHTRQEPTEKQACSVNDVAEQAMDLARPYASAQGATLRLELDPVVPLVSMNPLEIELVMVNLIRNAIEAGNGNVQVCVSTAQTEWGVRVTVRDNGCGMDEEQLAHVFDPLHTTRRHLGGSGLGMSIAYDIIHEHEGRLEVRSRRGKGTTIVIDLPAASDADRSCGKKGHVDHGSHSDSGDQSVLRRCLGLYAGGGET